MLALHDLVEADHDICAL